MKVITKEYYSKTTYYAFTAEIENEEVEGSFIVFDNNGIQTEEIECDYELTEEQKKELTDLLYETD